MSLIMEGGHGSKEEEVRKLQALVKELELQNEELRTERECLMKDGGCSTPSAPSTPKKHHNLDAMVNIKIEDTMDEETWLFDSPKTKPHSTDWLRKDMDDPALLHSKRSLINKLDQIAMSPHHSPRHSFSPCSSSGVLSPESPSSSRGEIDTRTFVRSKKKKPALSYGETVNDENRNTLVKRADASSREYLARSSGSLGSEEEDRLSSASEGSFSYQLTDVADVNALARLQEESLKLPDPRRTTRGPGIRGGPTPSSNTPYSPPGSGGSQTSSQEDLIANTGSPRRVMRGLQGPRYLHSTTSREGSDLSTPPDSPYTSQHNLQYCNGRSVGGGSLPSVRGGVVGTGLSRGLDGSDPRLLDHHHTTTTPGSSRGTSPARCNTSYSSPSASNTDLRNNPHRSSKLHTPQKSRLSAPSPVRVPPMSASGLPQPSDIPKPKSSGIPRPGSRLQAPRARSAGGIPGPRFHPTPPDDWSEGCF